MNACGALTRRMQQCRHTRIRGIRIRVQQRRDRTISSKFGMQHHGACTCLREKTAVPGIGEESQGLAVRRLQRGNFGDARFRRAFESAAEADRQLSQRDAHEPSLDDWIILVHRKKVAEALFSDSTASAAGKRRGFCRLPCAIFFVASATGS
jgi:hypothetical protein